MSNTDIVQGTLIVGRISAVFGVRGWVKVMSFTEQTSKIFDYQPWLVDKEGRLESIQVDEWKNHGDGLVVRFKGIDDRDVARSWCLKDIRVDAALLPELSDSEFYWHQLENLVVYNHFEDTEERLGVVTSLLETGANDVIVVKGDVESIDLRERLIPYSKQYVLKIDLGAQRIDVTWDPDF
ncbi:MAG: ribosome maturation factor RimM [Cellvibrionales bacterium TMED47]|nr:ribosome maturation factor RimM [Porticoccaceae bacterium]RPG83199.1 MAG: ribosome maturation factor RimM [Cellvibrionales bacterium TMED47]|tara:strand:- start:1395 stop:1937 length:543 start_codon:yes stop_codon:yes gene_type:complete